MVWNPNPQGGGKGSVGTYAPGSPLMTQLQQAQQQQQQPAVPKTYADRLPWQNPEAFRYGEFSPDANSMVNRLEGRSVALQNQAGPTVAPVTYQQAQIDPGRVAASNAALGAAGGIQGRQNAALDQLTAAANGQAPSVAQQQLASGEQASERSALSLANSARGGAGNGVAAIRAAINSNAANQQNLNQQTAQLRAGEMATARGELGQALGQVRGQDLQTADLTFGQGLQTGQFGAQQNQFGANLAAGQAGLNAQLEAGQRDLALRGGLGYGGEELQTQGMDQAERDAMANLRNSRDLAERGLAFQQGQADFGNTMKEIGTAAATVAPFVMMASDVRSKKDVEPADANQGGVTAAIAKGLAAGGATATGQDVPDWASPEKSNAKTAASRAMDETEKNPQGSHAAQTAAAQQAQAGQRDADLAQWRASLPSAGETEAWAAQHPLTGAPQYTNTWALGSGLNVPGMGATPAYVGPYARQPAVAPVGGGYPGALGAPITSRYMVSDTEAKRDAAREPAIDLRPAQGFWYNYKDPNAPGADADRHLGPMAQHLEQTPAGASVVKTGPDGKKMVDTGRLSLVNTSAIAEEQRRAQDNETRLRALEQRLGMGAL